MDHRKYSVHELILLTVISLGWVRNILPGHIYVLFLPSLLLVYVLHVPLTKALYTYRTVLNLPLLKKDTNSALSRVSSYSDRS